jgi:hypothetical protein
MIRIRSEQEDIKGKDLIMVVEVEGWALQDTITFNVKITYEYVLGSLDN